ncbi:hypothetical protein J2X47_004109 [Sphingomonas sp. BE270]|jgi:hypothetical protein|nr:hypothetical protein [Sphingomonas sp. BE270]
MTKTAKPIGGGVPTAAVTTLGFVLVGLSGAHLPWDRSAM